MQSQEGMCIHKSSWQYSSPNKPNNPTQRGGLDKLLLCYFAVSALLPGDCRARWVVKLDKAGFAVSTGSACASGKEAPSHVLQAMGVAEEDTDRVVRFSSGWETTADDWQALAEGLAEVMAAMAVA